MEKRLQTLKGKITWYLTLINENVDDLLDTELVALWKDLRTLAYGDLALFVLPDHKLAAGIKEERAKTKEIRKELMSCLERMLKSVTKRKKNMVRPLFGSFDVLEEAYEGLDRQGIGEIENVLTELISCDLEKKPYPKWLIPYIVISRTPTMASIVKGEKVYYFMPNLIDRVIIDFINVLSQIKLTQIKRCLRDDCRKYFLRWTLKEKRYCSNKCAWIVISRHKRETQPEKERAKKREAYYRRKIRELGHPVRIKKRKG